MKVRIPRVIRRTIISVVVLVILFLAAGVAYVLIADGNVSHPPAATPKKSADQEPSLPKPVAPAANAQEGVSVETVTSPVAAGSNAAITVSTNAGSKCSITVTYNGVKSTDSGLAPKTADAYGTVNWTWTVGGSVPAGNWPIEVTCVYNGRSGVSASSLQVTK